MTNHTTHVPAGRGPHQLVIGSVTGPESARYLIISTSAGIDTFFADAGEPIEHAELPSEPLAFDRERLLAAFAKHGNQPHQFPAKETAAVDDPRAGAPGRARSRPIADADWPATGPPPRPS